MKISDFDRSKTYLLAVSGGVDSMVLLRQATDAGLTFGVAHVDHQLREESGADALFVRQAARAAGVPFYLKSLDVWGLSQGRSVEDCARRVRREFLEEVRVAFQYDYIVLAHHADDQAETVFLNFLRGTSVHGLGGMLAVDEDTHILRPYLSLPKSVLMQFALDATLKWVEDQTNHEDNYDRNWLRNTVFPELETRRGRVKSILAAKAEHFQQLSDYLTMQAEAWVAGQSPKAFDKSAFLALHVVMRGEVLAMYWKHLYGSKNGFSEKAVREVVRWLDGNPEGGSKVNFGSGWLELRRSKVHVLERTP